MVVAHAHGCHSARARSRRGVAGLREAAAVEIIAAHLSAGGVVRESAQPFGRKLRWRLAGKDESSDDLRAEDFCAPFYTRYMQDADYLARHIWSRRDWCSGIPTLEES